MHLCSIMSREWKITVKTVFSVMILILLHLVLSTPTEAATVWQRAVVRASDRQVYEIQYTKPLNIENFSIRGLDGTIPSRETAAELYIAVQILNNSFTAAHLYNRDELHDLVHGEAFHTAKWRGYHTLATFVGSVSAGYLVSIATGALEISASLIESEVGKAAVQALTTTTLIVGEEQVATEAYIVTEAYIELAFAKRWIFDELVSSAEVGTEVSIPDIRSAYNALLQADAYVKYAHWMLNEYLVLPDRWERLWTFAKTIFPPTAIGQFFASQAQNIDDLRHLQTVFAESDRHILTAVSAVVNATFSEAAKSKFIWNLASAGFFDREPPTAAFIEDMQLMVGDGPRLLDIATIFSDLNGDRLEHEVEVTDSTVADVGFILFRPDGELTFRSFLEITPKRVGSTSVTIQATDPTRLSATQTFTVSVDPAALPNQPPEAVNRIPAQSLTLGSASPPLDAAVYFHDPDGGTIFYTAESSDRAVATTQRTGSQITIWPRGIGTAIITVTAANSDELSATQTFTVTVTSNEIPTERPTAQGLSNGDAIIVQNTGSDGLNIRSDPQVRNQNPDNRIGLVYDGATGTITAGPREADGYIWWEVEWDASNNRGWSVESIGGPGLLARRPPEPVTQSFDLAIQPLSVSKQTLAPGESFTLSITLHNNGPGDAPGPALSYYHSSIHGFSPTDPPQLQGTVSLEPLASGESRTQLIQLVASATPKTYYYGAWLAANTGDTNLNNDFATEIGVTVVDDTIDDPVDTSDPPDLIIANISVDFDRMYPEERFTISATVRNAGGRQAANARVRYYRSSDEIYSPDDEEIANTDDFIGRLEGGETSNETANLDAPGDQGVYYYIARAEPVRNEVDTDNNYASVKITVLPPAAPDLVVVSLTSNRYLVDPGRYFRLDAIIRNQGEENARQRATVRFYRSSDPLPSPDDEEIGTDSIRALRDGSTDDGVENGPAPEQPGTYYYYACVDSVPDERNTDNNCSNVVTINVRGPDLAINTVSVDYFSRTHTTVRPDGIFELEVTVRNQGTEDADDSTLRYYISSDSTLSSDDTEVATDWVNSLDMNETSRTYKSDWIDVPYTSGFFYALVCVDSVEDETDTTNNCYAPIKLTVRNYAPRAEGTIPAQTLSAGTSTPLDVSAYFADTNNDALIHTANSSDPNIVTVRVSGPQVTLTPQRTGNVNVTVTASDGQLTATQTFSVSVMEVETKAPDLLVESVSLDKNTVTPGETFRLNAVVKNQGDADARTVPIRYYQSTDDTISETDTQLRTGTLAVITADGMRELSVALTAPNTPGTYYYGVGVENVADESDTANNYSIGVAISVENRAPISVGTLPPRTLSENDTPVAVDVAQHFTDPDNTALTYTAASDNPAVVMAEMRGSEMTITPVGTGNAIVTVTASDGELTATQTLTVSVVAAPTENEAPLPIGVIPAQSLTVDGTSSTVDISAYFSDANGDTLTYAVWPDDKNVVRLRREGTLLTITPKAAGRATVTVRARDPDGLQALQPISVFVSTTEVPVTELPAETWMPDANLRTAVRTALGLGPNDALTQQALQSLTSLRYLGPDLSDNQKITDLTGLEHALNLEHLDLYMHLISDLRPLERLTKLRSLWLAGNKISNIRPLTNLPLEELDLGGNPIADFAPLAELTSLTRLDFWGNGLGNSNLSIITGLTQLTQLDLRNNQISDVTTLTKLVNLKKLQLKGNPISDTAPLLTLTSQNPDLDIDIEISDEPPSEPDTEIEVEVPDLIVESIRANKTAVDLGDVFRLDAVIKNQGKAPSGAATVRFYRSQDAAITAEDTQVRTADLPSVAVDATRNKWVRLTAPKTAGVYYYGVCIGDVANEGNTENNCSTAVKITVGTVTVEPPTVEPPVVETPATTDPEAEGSLAKQVFEKHSNILQRQDVKAVLPDVFTVLKEPDTQALLNPHTIELVIADPDLLKKMVPTISDKFITLMKTDAEIKTLLSDAQVQTLLQTPTTIDELARLLGVSIAPPPTANEHWMPDANLRAAVRKALGLKPSETLTPQAMRKLTRLSADLPQDPAVKDKIKNITGLEHATQLTWLSLHHNQVSDISPVAKLTKLTTLCLNYNQISNINPVKDLTNLWQLCLIGNQIGDINPVKDLTNLTRLVVSQNKKISDIKILKGLTKLVDLALSENQISDITALENLTNLKTLWLHRNRIRDITPLEGLTNLTLLFLDNNQISDVTPLENLTSLGVLYISGNPIGDVAPLRRLKAKNPNMEIDIDIGVGAAPSAPLVPDETALFSNYPNPFNPETWIPYQLAESADVTVTIYDVRGVVVRRLALGHQTVGFYQSRARAAHWDSRNALGEKVASGLYFYTFTAGDFTATGKMLIRK